MRQENQTIIKALNMFGRVPETYELLNEIERLNNKIKEQSLLLIEFQDMEQRLKEKVNIIDELENMLINELKNSYSLVEYKQVINLILYKLKTERK